MILRKFLNQRLSNYFSQPSKLVVGSIKDNKPINFSYLLNSWHWNRTYQKVLDNQDGQWITPTELFRPHFSNIIANVIVNDISKVVGTSSTTTTNSSNRLDDTSDIHIFELGAGKGTNAKLILSYLKDQHPSIYSRITYYLIDSSPTLNKYQKDTFLEGNDNEHEGKVKFILDDLMNISTGDSKFLNNERSNVITYTLAFEVLDNLPHDKIIRCKDTGSLLQAEVYPIGNNNKNNDSSSSSNNSMDDNDGDDLKYQEKYAPLSDPLLKKVIKFFPSHYCKSIQWVPTVAYGIIQQLFYHRPNSRLIIADFDWLPPPELGSSSSSSKLAFHKGGPLITSMDKIDYGCYLTSPPFCDILFPSSFKHLLYFTKKNIT